MAMTERGKKYRRTMIAKFGGCVVYDGCPKCEEAIEKYLNYQQERGKRPKRPRASTTSNSLPGAKVTSDEA